MKNSGAATDRRSAGSDRDEHQGIENEGPETAGDEGRAAEFAFRVHVYVPVPISAPIVYQDGAPGW